MMTAETLKLHLKDLRKRRQEISKIMAERADDERFRFIPGFQTGLLRIVSVTELHVEQSDCSHDLEEALSLPILSPQKAVILGIDKMVTEGEPSASNGPVVGYFVRSELDIELIGALRTIQQQIAIELAK
jgi:hypothetical protein